MSKLHLSRTGPDEGLHFWLLDDDDIPVSYAKAYEDTREEGTVISLCDIETRSTRRNEGHATELLKRIAQGYGVDKITHSGSFTSDGANFIAHQLKRPSEAGEVKASCGPMRFVHDWDKLETMYP